MIGGVLEQVVVWKPELKKGSSIKSLIDAKLAKFIAEILSTFTRIACMPVHERALSRCHGALG